VVALPSSQAEISPGNIRIKRGLIRRTRRWPFSTWISRKRLETPSHSASSTTLIGRFGKSNDATGGGTQGTESFFIFLHHAKTRFAPVFRFYGLKSKESRLDLDFRALALNLTAILAA
jgi:hypothetical protein